MRVKALGDSTSVIWPAAMFAGTWMLVVIMLVLGWGIKDAMSAERVDSCNVSRVTFEKQQAMTGHKLISPIEESWRVRFINAWNMSPPKAEGATDAALYEVSENAPFTRLAFFDHDCFIDYFDLPTKLLQQFIEKMVKGAPRI